jgi:Holliday junction resolvasome RuvABC endonuclease subunit
MILALDLGLKTGFAIGLDGILIESGVLKLPNKKSGEKFFFFNKWLEEKHSEKNFKLIAFEHVNFIGNRTSPCSAHAYGGYLAFLESFAYKEAIPTKRLTVREIKKGISGKSNCDKSEIIKNVNEAGIQVTDDNEADAIAIFLLINKNYTGNHVN